MSLKIMSPCNKKENRPIPAFSRRKIRETSGIQNESILKFFRTNQKVVSLGFRLPREVYDVFVLLRC